jgi:hypothetical protein
MSELNENIWSVISERGVEVAHLTYAEAREAERQLLIQKISGCAIITDAAAARIQSNNEMIISQSNR